MLNYIVWNVEPEIFSIVFLHIRWYGLMWALAILSAWWMVTKIFKHEKCPDLWSDKMFIYGAVGLIIGARLGHCLFYEWDGMPFFSRNEYLIHPWKLLYVWQGGLASHGGAIGLLVAMWLYTRNVTKKSYLYILDRLVIGVAIGGMFIRFGNLMNSEIYGGITNVPWGFIFVRDGQVAPCHPTQIYEMLYCLITFVVTMLMYWKWESYKCEGLIFGVFLLMIFGTRFLLEFIKLNQEEFEANMLLNMGQILSLPLIMWGIYLLCRKKKLKDEK